MKNRKRNIAIGVLVAVIAVGVIVLAIKAVNNGKEEELAVTAMYVPIAEDAYIFVDQNNGAVFTVTFPEKMYDIDGNIITQNELVKGNILKIYGNGIMLESYPGQYPGISKMKVIETGSPADADVYQNIIDELYSAPDPSEPPFLNVEYTTDTAVVTVMATRGDYEWSYTDGNGEGKSEIACGPHILCWGDLLVDIRLGVAEPVDFTLIFSVQPQEVKVFRYDLLLKDTEGEIPDGGEEVEIEEKDGKWMLPSVEGGYIYEVIGIWDNGRATYGFLTNS